MKDLVIRVTGAVQESNLEEWKISAFEMINGINTELVTDDDFANASKDIKACGEIEKKLEDAKSAILNQTADISSAIEAISDVQEKFRQTRLELTRLEKTEKEKRKNKVIEEGYESLCALYSNSDVAFHLGRPDKKLILDAVKGKRTFDSMNKEIRDTIVNEQARIEQIETIFHKNIILIDSIEKNSLFPDKMELATKTEVEVRAVIESRLAKYELEQKQAEEEKRDKEELARKEAELASHEQAQPKEEMLPEPSAEQPSFIPPPPPVDDVEQDSFIYVVTAKINGKESAIDLAKMIDAMPDVKEVKITRVDA